ncbi:MAG: hypothetical protein ACLFPR_03320 [Desulfococcaceae bacterium]
MKTGVILYVRNGDSTQIPDEETAIRSLNLSADRVDLVFSGESAYDLWDSWWKLTRKGMHRIVCKTAEISGNALRLTGKEMQLRAV